MSERHTPKLPENEANPNSPSLRRRALVGTAWTLGGHFFNQGLRLVSNLILTRLLYPEAFGLMALVQTFISGLEMFSDVGVGPSIIQNKRGNKPAFLNTAWTIQSIRGVCLWLCACVIAYPAASLYHQPMLTQLLPIVGLQSLIGGMISTKLVVANRQLALARLTVIDIATQIVGLGVMVVGAWLYRSVWALVVGGLAAMTLKLVLTHTFLEGTSNRFAWNQEALKELQRFGRWVFISTILTFFALQSDRLFIPGLAGVGFLGIYTVAFTLSQTMSNVISAVGGRVLFPSYAELVRERPERLYPVLRKTRLLMLMINWGAALLFIRFGKQLIDIMYDDRYSDAGWILQALAIGLLADSIGQSYGNVLLAHGRTFEMMAIQALQMTLKLAGILIGYTLAGKYGLIFGIAFVGWFTYPMQAICFRRLGLWQPEVDLPFLVVGLGIMVLCFVLQVVPNPFFS